METRLYRLQEAKKRKTNSLNAYVPKFMPKDLSWYERDGLMTRYNQGKFEDFLRDTDEDF